MAGLLGRVLPQVLHLNPLQGSNFYLLPRKREDDAKLSWEPKETNMSQVTYTAFWLLPTKLRKQEALSQGFIRNGKISGLPYRHWPNMCIILYKILNLKCVLSQKVWVYTYYHRTLIMFPIGKLSCHQVKSDEVWRCRWVIYTFQLRSNTLSYNPANYSFLENRVREGKYLLTLA